MYNVSVPIPDEVLFDAHLTKKLSETYVRRKQTLSVFCRRMVFLSLTLRTKRN